MKKTLQALAFSLGSAILATTAVAHVETYEPKLGAPDVSILRHTGNFRYKSNCKTYGPCSKGMCPHAMKPVAK
ncbi:MAG: hypothetical protein HRF45_01485 [Fimbriimonadia bacterium]|jgi:hypothetical protein